jgi:hypothetical protein
MTKPIYATDWWYPVRLNAEDGREFILLDEFALDSETARQAGEETDIKSGPSWAAGNPVVRIARFDVVVTERA